jgi:protein-tyrosine kinase
VGHAALEFPDLAENTLSRLDEALRRKGQGGSKRVSDDGDGVFVSAWDAADELRSEQAPPEPIRVPAPITPMPLRETVRPHERPMIPDARAEERSPVALSRNWGERLAIAPEAHPMLVEQYRRLAATLHHAQIAGGIRRVMVTSASSDDGKTLTAVNLALVLSESYRRRVLLIDADLRRPSLGNVVDVTNAPGLSDALKAPHETKLGILQVTPMLMVLPAGRPDPDPMGGLTSARMRHILEEAAGRFDWVILDAPPMGPMADASLLSQMVDGAVFVLRAGRTQYSLVQKAVEALGRERILGVVLNGVDRMPPEQYEYPYGEALATQP